MRRRRVALLTTTAFVLAFPALASAAPSRGVNNWSCKPSAAHREPVVLVHGLLGNGSDNWALMAPLLARNGFCVYALTYGALPGETFVGGLQPMEQSAHQLAWFVNRVLSATHAHKVDLVGHSEGTVMPRYYMEFLGGRAKVHRYVMLTPLWHGTNVLLAATLMAVGERFYPQATHEFLKAFGIITKCRSCQEFISGSQFLHNLNAHGMALPGVVYTDVVTRYDELVVPYTSGILHASNVTNYVLQDQCRVDFSEHVWTAFDPIAAQDALNALDPPHARPVPCVPVFPGVPLPFPSSVGLGH